MSALGNRASRLAVAMWNQVKRSWYAGALTVACTLFTASYWLDQRDADSLDGHLQEVAERGGGLVVVYSGLECGYILRFLFNLTDRLQADRVPIVGLLFTDSETELFTDRFPSWLQEAADRLPHKHVRWRTVRPIAELTGTPMVVGVDAAGRIRFAEHVDSLLGDDRGESAHGNMLARLDLPG